jgi:hypothetical protein
MPATRLLGLKCERRFPACLGLISVGRSDWDTAASQIAFLWRLVLTNSNGARATTRGPHDYEILRYGGDWFYCDTFFHGIRRCSGSSGRNRLRLVGGQPGCRTGRGRGRRSGRWGRGRSRRGARHRSSSLISRLSKWIHGISTPPDRKTGREVLTSHRPAPFLSHSLVPLGVSPRPRGAAAWRGLSEFLILSQLLDRPEWKGRSRCFELTVALLCRPVYRGGKPVLPTSLSLRRSTTRSARTEACPTMKLSAMPTTVSMFSPHSSRVAGMIG